MERRLMRQSLKDQIWIAVLAALLFIPGLGLVHLFDWDEINFAESAREMLASGNYFRVQINFQPFWEKPPLFIWLQALCMQIFGVNEFAARLPNALTGIATLLILYRIGLKVYNRLFAWIWVLVYTGTFLSHFYFKSGIIDPLFNLLIFSSIWFWYLCAESQDFKAQRKQALWAGICVGLAILTKGPVALLVTGICVFVYGLTQKKYHLFAPKVLWPSLLAILGIVFLWFGPETILHGPWFLEEFITYQIRLFSTGDSGHGQPPWYHPIVLTIGCFPASVFFYAYLFQKKSFAASKETVFAFWMLLLFAVVLILFSIVKTKIVHYSSLCYFGMTFGAARILYQSIADKKPWSLSVRIFLTVLGLFWSILLTSAPLIDVFKAQILPLIQDPFAVDNLGADVHWPLYLMSFGILLLFATIYVSWIAKSQVKNATIVLFTVSALVCQGVIYCFVPRIEGYTQRAAIEFMISKEHEDCYVHAIGYKSFAHYYYTKRKANYPLLASDETWLLEGAIDKPVYLVTKTDRDNYQERFHLTKVGTKNGFVFYLRKPHSSHE